MIYGWGRKNKDWTMPDGRVLVCSYSYFSLLFVLQLVWKRRWTLIGRDRAMDQETNRAELARIYGDGNVPDIGIFERFGAILFGGAIVGLAALVAIWGVVASAIGLDSESTEASGPVAEVVASDGLTDADEADPSAATDDGTDDDGQDDDEDSSRSISGSAASEGDDADADPAATDADDADGAAAPGSDDDDDGTRAGDTFYEEAVDISPSATPALMSTNIDRPFQGWSEITVHGANATTRLDDQSAPAGEKFVVVDYQVLGVEANANFLDNAFRLIAGDDQFSPVAPNINRTVAAGDVVNDQIVFAVPVAATDFRFEAGIVDVADDGYQSSFEFSLTPGIAPESPVRATGPDMVGEVTLASPDNLMFGTPHNLNPNWSPLEVEVIEATRAAKVGPDGARPGFVFVVLEVEATATGPYGLWQTPSFRVEADGELYGHTVYINESLSTGETARASLLFEVPSSVFSLQLEAGVPETFDIGERAVFDITFD